MQMKTLVSLVAVGAAAATGASAQGWESSVDVGLFSATRSSTDTAITASPFVGTYLGGYGSTNVGSLKFAIDGRVEFLDDRGINDVYETGPVHAGVLGLHLGTQTGSTYYGGFVGAGLFDGYDSESPMGGHIFGVEAEHYLADGSSFYGQLGYAEAIGNSGDNEFRGYSAKVGYLSQLSDRLSLNMSLETAFSRDCFEDCNGDWGRYTAAGIEAAYSLNNRVDLVGAINYADIQANTEDSGSSANIYLGVRMPLGAKPKSALRTPMGAFNGAGWMAPLD